MAVRGAILILVAALSLRAVPTWYVLVWIALMAAAGLPAVLRPAQPVIGPLSRLAEVVITCLAAAAITHAAHRPAAGIGTAAIVLSYLWVPGVSAALARRRFEAPLLLAAAAVVLVAARLADPSLGATGYTGSSILWLWLSGVAAGVAVFVQQSLLSERDSPQPYAEATRLLTQLRTVARQLPGATLDPGGLAEHLLDELRAVVPATRAAVLSASGGGRLVVLAQMGADRVDWETGLDADSAIADAWASQQPQTANRSQARSAVTPGTEVSALIVPLVAGVRTVGLIALETDTPGAYPPPLVARAAQVAAPAALRLEAALLFDEVRSLATSEERQRLAREIHDGVAQELVMVGYGIDNALAALPDVDATTEELRVLRSEVTRVITELRLSLFELRSEVDRYGGLATAIADYARTVGQSAGLRVHLSLDESTARLPAATEAELLRIAQEAITNARKHAGAENLWVTCTIDPPFAEIEVSDDGHGMVDTPKEGRYGLAIMAERAERIRGRLEIRPRVPNGTTVAVVLGSAPRRGSV
ncbi:GAF domain-containing protein [Planosporangium thailandense]|uniref:GAF domain-containing protein n=1 Tax=Planosporangium thailandense TaxID=765197 RepID=A0ABX0XUK8_9ACTN|nr:histidine kinase [Planosporangium thailandense]NJC69711.1 GAF domain-containing protein [Planosporangium thailandense]